MITTATESTRYNLSMKMKENKNDKHQVDKRDYPEKVTTNIN